MPRRAPALVNGMLVLSILAFGPAASRAATLYVDGQIGSASCTNYAPASRSCSGGSDRAYRTVAGAAAAAVAGDTVYLRAGTYSEQLSPARSGTASLPITFAAYPGENPALSGVSSPALWLIQRSYIVVDGLTVTNVGGWGRLEDATYNTIRNCTFTIATDRGHHRRPQARPLHLQQDPRQHLRRRKRQHRHPGVRPQRRPGQHRLAPGATPCSACAAATTTSSAATPSPTPTRRTSRSTTARAPPTPRSSSTPPSATSSRATSSPTPAPPRPTTTTTASSSAASRASSAATSSATTSGGGDQLPVLLRRVALQQPQPRLPQHLLQQPLLRHRRADAATRSRYFDNRARNNILYKNTDCSGAGRPDLDRQPLRRSSSRTTRSPPRSPGFVDEAARDLHLAPGSPMIDAAAFLTTATAAGSGTQTHRRRRQLLLRRLRHPRRAGRRDPAPGPDHRRPRPRRRPRRQPPHPRPLPLLDRGAGVALRYAGDKPDLGAHESAIGSMPPVQLTVAKAGTGSRHRHLLSRRHQLRRRLLRALQLRNRRHPQPGRHRRLHLRRMERGLHRNRRLLGHHERRPGPSPPPSTSIPLHPHRREGGHRHRHRHLLPRRHQLRRRLLRALQLRHRRHPQPGRHRRLHLRRLERSLHRNRRLPGHHERRPSRHRHLQPHPLHPHRREGGHRHRHRHLLARRHQLRRRLLRALQLRHRRHPQPRRHRRLDLRRLERGLHRNRRLPGHHERRPSPSPPPSTSIPYTLTVAKAGTGTGTVTSSPAGISCGADCSEPYSSGTVVTLTPGRHRRLVLRRLERGLHRNRRLLRSP